MVAGVPFHGAADGEPGADLTDAVAGFHEFVVGHVQQQVVGQRLPFQFLEEPAVEILLDVAYPRLADEMRQPSGANQSHPFQPVVGANRRTHGLAELIALPQRHQRRGGAVQDDRHHRQFHLRVQFVVHRHEPVVELHLVRQSRVETVGHQSLEHVISQPRVTGDDRLRYVQPLLQRPLMPAAQTDRDLRQVLQEEVGEMLTGHEHDRLRTGIGRLLAHLRQPTEESLGLIGRCGLLVGAHHRRMRGRIRHHDVSHLTLRCSVAGAAASRSGR